MPRGTLIGRLFGTDVYATLGFLLLMAVLLFINPEMRWAVAVWELALIVSVLVHEFGHVFAVRWLLGRPSTVVLWGLGGLCIHEPTDVIRNRIAISLMGPAFGFALGGLSLLVQEFWLPEGAGAVVGTFVWAMVRINIVYTGLNLIPIMPLDGGQASLAALELKLKPPQARRLIRGVSVVMAAAGMVLALQFGLTWAAFLAALLLIQNLFAAQYGL